MSVNINSNWYVLAYNIQPIFLKQNEITVTMFQMNKNSMQHCNAITILSVCTYIEIFIDI